jgi:RimJ/RimL family protein N-acetyltransferase
LRQTQLAGLGAQAEILIRPITLEDAGAFLALGKRLDEETQFMMLEPGERQLTLEDQQERITAWLDDIRSGVFVAAAPDKLVGFIALQGGAYRRNQHCAYIVVGVRQAFAGQGIGTRLFAAGERWARERHMHRLDLTVMVHNTRAISLYQKLGFAIEGTRKHSLQVNDRYVDEYAMAKLLDEWKSSS